MGTGLSCLSCRFSLGQEHADPVGETAEKTISNAIDRRARSLTQGLIGKAIEAAGDSSLTAILAAAQAGEFKNIVDEDFLSDDLVKRLAKVLSKTKHQTVASNQVFGYVAEHPHLTAENIDAWLTDLKALLEASFEQARKENPGKEITLLLKAGDDQQD